MQEAALSPVVDSTPAQPPEAVTLEGRFCRIEKLDAGRHAGGLWEAVKDDDSLWLYLSAGPFRDRETFRQWVEERSGLADPFAYAVIDKARDAAVGIVTLMEIRPAMRVIEMGSILYGTPLQRRPAATEAQYLMAHHVFETLGYRRYEWKCNTLNAPSRAAALRLGFTFEGIFRHHMIVKGRSRDTAWFAMLDSDWPARKAAFERWLAPDNFDAEGNQLSRLSAFRE